MVKLIDFEKRMKREIVSLFKIILKRIKELITFENDVFDLNKFETDLIQFSLINSLFAPMQQIKK